MERPENSATRGRDLTEDLRLAHMLADNVDSITMSRFKAQDLEVSTKPDLTPVTDADRAAERFVADVLAALRGDDGVLGEEGANRPSATGRTWVIDPVDGTYNFSQGSDYFCSALALVDAGSAHTPAIGAVHRPATGTTWLAVDGTATRDGVALGGLPEASIGGLLDVFADTGVELAH